ncbi:hypothetical protein B6D60_04300 [candidate division KSB1 bacterium 4484_87]|nr:MAG: hypothetical protein B6D60_04300 [candidate division KSB1 bacterium 4484_87]
MQNSAISKKMLLIGLEGATFRQIKKLMQQQKLPFFSRFYNSGVHAQLIAPYPVNRASSWASFFSGKRPGNHNLFDFLDHHKNPAAPELLMADSGTHKWLWDILNQTELKTIFFNIPIMSAPKAVNGVFVSGFATPEGEKIAFPDSLNKEIAKQLGHIEIGLPARKKNGDYFHTALEMAKKQFTIFRDLLTNQEWNLALLTTNILDRLLPIYWNDPDKIEHVYRELDSLLAMIEQALADDVSIIIFSNFGYSPVSKKFFVNEWLWEQGWQQRRISTEKTFISDIDEYFLIHANGNGRIIPGLLAKSGLTKNNIRSLLPNNVSEILNKTVPRALKKLFHTEYLNISWDKSKAFFFSHNLQGIQINVKGRDPQGIVSPGREYERFRKQIISELFHLKDPYTFEHVFEDVFLKEEVFNGEFAQNAPDIILVPRKNNYFLHPQKRTSRMCIGSANDDNPVFAQRDNSGMFLMRSPENAAVRKAKNIDIVDIVPTILAYFDISEKEKFDGIVRKDLLGEIVVQLYEETSFNFIPEEKANSLDSSSVIPAMSQRPVAP